MSQSFLVQQVENVYRQSFRPGEELSRSEILDFVDYVLSFYGHGTQAIYKYGFTVDEVLNGLIKRFHYRPAIDFDGDTVDRELVRDMVLEIRDREMEVV